LQLNQNNMKYIFIILVAALVASCNANDHSAHSEEDSAARAKRLDAAMDTNNVTQIQWLDSIQQKLGKVKEGEQVAISWRFKNVGTKNLVIGNVSAGCGCTIPETPKEPIKPGEEGVIKAIFNSNNQMGSQNKNVMVMANTNPNSHALGFSIEVEKK
jgi:hypothetical protein